MLVLETQHVRMNQHAIDKAQALQCLVNILVEDQLVTPEYIDGLNNREQQGATYLGQGIAIPHGTPESRQFIQQTGVRLAHFPEGVLWDGENKIYLAVVIAAKSDEHLQVLQILTRALISDLEDQVKNAQSPEQIIALLQAQPASLALHENLIATQVPAQDIDDLIWQASQLLKQQHMVQCGFLSGLNLKQMIHLGDGIWSISSNQHVLNPAVSIVKTETPLDFEQQTLSTLVCIASNDQLDLSRLHQLMDILFDTTQSQSIQSEQDEHQLAQLLGAEVIPDWPSQQIILANAHGLHARPATQLVNLTKQFSGDIQVAVDDGAYVSAKSLTKLLALGCRRGQRLTFIAQPETDAVDALVQIIDAVRQGLGEEVEQFDEQSLSTAQTTDNTPLISFESDAQLENTGIAASTGLAFGPAHVVKPREFDYVREGQSFKAENERLEIALHQVKNHLHQFIAHTSADEIKQIFMAHLEMLDDPDLMQSVQRGLKQGLSAPAAWHDHIDAAATAQAALSDRLLAERAADLRDIGERVLAVLCDAPEITEPEQPYILIMHDVGPSDVARLNKDRVAGILTAVGGASAHSAIVARALAIPAVVGAGDAVLNIDPHATVLINGDTGEFVVAPEQAQIEDAIATRERQRELRAQAQQHCLEPAITQDQHQLEIAANIGKVSATAQAVTDGAEAIGLLRTELVFMSHNSAPDEQAQEADYRVVLDALAGRPLVVRTLDVGGDKPLPYLPIAEEENPFLGLRGIRLTLRKPTLLRQQLLALLKAADDRPLRIMFPMIGRVEEWRAAKAILDEFRTEYPCNNLQVGIMIEVPSAALLAPILAQEVDFFSIGTNDLTQYTMAIDRGHPLLSAEADGLHPSVLLLIDQTVRAAHEHGKWVGICGELAADPKAVPVLMGLGVDELSMSSTSIPLVKAQIRGLNYTECQRIAQHALKCESASAVRALVEC
ncbi:Phosphocarrier protein HPr /phosphoenolpyruvate--protein phosphotransferase /PTS system D-fructose-specific IIA component (F1P-forming), Frc family [Acinetobacter marinus]|uniref:phosphoenolpyruvate--protein phosphotransferase n=1 Tax=Acinetobacter marinus TaxID=281375 RepID=A0A1G6HK34_9GAMM|nr:phosphoenolpyruvate--protein phosphotransferase [Acinetobacter marinus]SDB94612.1 Phosphocarrier protein HPr /phosphoenolpyruvate--protein phosphotransferase /PTS system D-fructose-specific IIA component (F1P-forming), Frc family [Acinetobacter marinus]